MDYPWGPARADTPPAPRLAATRNRRARAALAELIRIGQADGEIHPDLTAGDLYLLLSTAPTDRRASDRARWLELVYRAITA
jgi:hypothetical protein